MYDNLEVILFKEYLSENILAVIYGLNQIIKNNQQINFYVTATLQRLAQISLCLVNKDLDKVISKLNIDKTRIPTIMDRRVRNTLLHMDERIHKVITSPKYNDELMINSVIALISSLTKGQLLFSYDTIKREIVGYDDKFNEIHISINDIFKEVDYILDCLRQIDNIGEK